MRSLAAGGVVGVQLANVSAACAKLCVVASSSNSFPFLHLQMATVGYRSASCVCMPPDRAILLFTLSPFPRKS
jgi:hypothetical protein